MMEKPLILAVDDEPINLKLLEHVFGKDFKIITVTNGVDALQICSNERVDLVLLDVMMPEMDGYEVCKRIKSNLGTKHIPVIFLTAKTETADLVKGFEVGGVDYVTKPFNKIELLARVRTHIEVKILRGILPLCSHCKKIRDDNNYWEQVDVYIHKYSEADISHSVCPECMRQYYPEFFKEESQDEHQPI